MPSRSSNRIFTWLLLTATAIVALAFFFVTPKKEIPVEIKQAPVVAQVAPAPTPTVRLIGRSVEGRNIEAYTYGDGPDHIVFIGGIHGGYEWNSVLLAYGIIDHLNEHLDRIPKNLTIDILPSVNPDAIYKVTGKVGRFSAQDVTLDKKILASARFNAHDVDLNRNFDCNWKPKSMWQSKTVSAGASVFSEPETRTIKDFLLKYKPVATIFWHSKSNGVYASQCGKGILSATKNLMNTYARASGYPAIETFDAYEITGAAEDWLASINIPAITVELTTHETVELEKNIAGVEALMMYYKK